MLSCGNNSNRGNTILSSPDVPPLPQCLPLEPITLSNQKYTRSGELRRVLGVSLGSTSEDHTFGVGLKPPPPVATEELKNFKDSVQDASRKARDRAKMLRESIFKLDKYREAISSKKQQRNDLLSNERSGGSNLLKLRSQILRNPGSHATQRFEAKSQNTGLGLKKRIRTSMVDADGRSAVVSRQQIVTEKDRDVLKAGSGEDIQIEEKIRKLPVGGEGWEKKIKRKRSVGAVGNRAIDSDRDRKQAMHQKASADTKLRSCDALGFRLSIHEEKPEGSPSTMTKGKVSRAQRTGSIMNVESSTHGCPSSGALEGWELPATENKVPPLSMTNNRNRLMSTGSSAHPMAQWVGQRPHKISRTRRANLVSPVTKSDEAQILSQDFAASDLSSIYSSHGASKSLLVSSVDNNNPKSKMKLESIPSPIGLSGLSEGEESGGGENKLQGKGEKPGRVTVNADHNAGVSMLPSGKNKILVKEETGDGIHSQGRVGRFLSSTNPVVTHTRERVERLRTTKQLQSIRRVSDKNKSKSGRPPSKKLKDRKTSTCAGLVLNSSSEFAGEWDDDHEELLAAANSARNASQFASAGPFWKKMEYIFASVNSQDTSYLKQQLSFAEELNESLAQMFGDQYNTMGFLMHKEVPVYSGGRYGSCSNQESSQTDAFCERVGMGRRLDKVPSLFQRVLSALIEEDESEEFYLQNEGKNMSFQCASDDSHCGSCNHIDVEPKDRDRMESEVESEVDLQTQKHCFLDRFSCNKSASSNTHSNPSVSSSLCNNEQWQADDGLSQLDAGLVSGISQNELSVPHSSQMNVSDSSSFDYQYQMLCFDDRLLLQLRSIGLYPETMPDLSEGEEGINQDIMELQGGLFQQVGRLKKNLGKIGKAIQYSRDLERLNIEQVAMNQLVEMAYKKRMACRGSHSSKSVVRKVSKQVAMAFVKRTLARYQKFEDTGRSCFSEPPLLDIVFPAHLCNNDAKSVACVGPGAASNTYDEACNHKAEARSSATDAVCSTVERHHSRIDIMDQGSSDASGAIRTHFEQEPILNNGKKREVLLDDDVGGASPKISVIDTKPHGGMKGHKIERDGDQNRDMLTSNCVSGSGRPSLGCFRSEQKAKAKPKQNTNRMSISGNGLQGRFLEVKHSPSPSVRGPSQSVANVGNKLSREVGLPTPVNIRRDSSKEAEEPIDFANLQLSELDSIELGVSNDLGGHEDLCYLLDFDEDGLQDHDSIGLEIPMDDITELSMIL